MPRKINNQAGITTFWGISLILMMSIVVFFIFYVLYFFWIENPLPTSNILLIRTFAKQTLTVPDQLDTAGWIQYSDNSIGYNLKYPDNWVLANDQISYGAYDGKVFSLSNNNQEAFAMNIFNLEVGEDWVAAFRRLTGVDSTVYQSYQMEIKLANGIVLRLRTGRASSDRLYFTGNGYLFEVPLDQTAVNILSTFYFTEK